MMIIIMVASFMKNTLAIASFTEEICSPCLVIMLIEIYLLKAQLSRCPDFCVL